VADRDSRRDAPAGWHSHRDGIADEQPAYANANAAEQGKLMSWKVMWATTVVLMTVVGVTRAVDDDGGTDVWDSARASGFVGYLLLWGAVFTGAGSNLRFHPGVGKQAIVWELHRGCATLALAFVAAHMLALVLDPFVGFAVPDVLVGVTSDYRPAAVVLGALSLWLLVALLVTTAYSGAMPKSWWRGIHYTGYVAYGLALMHGLMAGSDSEHWPTHVIYTFTGGAIAGALFLRFFGRPWVEEQLEHAAEGPCHSSE